MIPPALLTRARSLAAEHTQLTTRNDQTYNLDTAKRVGELQPVADALHSYQRAEASIAELRSLLSDPSTEPELRDLAADDLSTATTELETVSRALTTTLTPKHPFEDHGCIIEIRPGAGGEEAGIFAINMYEMYQAYFARKRFPVNVLSETVVLADNGGRACVGETIMEVDYPGAYGQLRSEAGVHRVQRVPNTEQQGRTHTSAVSVLVLPSIADNSVVGDSKRHFDDPNSDYYVNAADVRTDVMRARGAGGQHVNTTDSAVRLTHIPTGTVVSMQESRSQHKNREKAWQILRGRLAQARREAREEEVAKLRRSVIGVAKMGRGDKVRTYNYKEQRITDHRSGFSAQVLNDAMAGGSSLDAIIDSVKSWLSERELEMVVAEEEEAAEAAAKKK